MNSPGEGFSGHQLRSVQIKPLDLMAAFILPEQQAVDAGDGLSPASVIDAGDQEHLPFSPVLGDVLACSELTCAPWA